MTKHINIDSSSIVDHAMFTPGSEETGQIIVGKNCAINGELISLGGKIKVGDNVVINQGSKILCSEEVTLEDHVMISWGCQIVDSNMHSLHSDDRRKDTATAAEAIRSHTIGQNVDHSNVVSKPIHIREGAWLGFNAIILKGVTIGKGAVVGAGSVVVKDVPDYAVVGGNPAVVLKYTD